MINKHCFFIHIEAFIVIWKANDISYCGLMNVVNIIALDQKKNVFHKGSSCQWIDFLNFCWQKQRPVPSFFETHRKKRQVNSLETVTLRFSNNKLWNRVSSASGSFCFLFGVDVWQIWDKKNKIMTPTELKVWEKLALYSLMETKEISFHSFRRLLQSTTRRHDDTKWLSLILLSNKQ